MNHLEAYILNTIDRRQRLRLALAKMPSRYHKLIAVLYLMGYNQREIAEGMEMTKQRVQQIIADFKAHNGLRYLEDK